MSEKDNILAELDEFEGLSQLVSRFSDAMRARLWERMKQGYHGWSDDSWDVAASMREKLFSSIDKYKAGEKKQLVDIANLAAILWLHEAER